MTPYTARRAGGLCLFLLLSACCTPDLAEVPLRIDVHAHTFHSLDVPVGGVAARISRVRAPVATIAAKISRRGGVGVLREAMVLRERLRARGRWDEEEDEQRFLALSRRESLVPNTPDVHPDVLVDELLRDPAATAELAASLGVGEAHGWTPESTTVPVLQAERIAAALRRYAPELFAWLQLLKHSRLELAARLGQTFSDIDLFTPAMADLGAWLGEEPSVRIEDQLLLGEWIMRVLVGRVHFFAPFDPLAAHRSAQGGGDDYFLAVADAVMQRGFVGFALYPMVGFYPGDNVARSPASPLLRPGEWRGIDTQLARLYAFCLEHEIPILAHTTPELEAGQGFAARGAPSEWHRALLALPKDRTLRLDLAGFGGGSRAWRDDVAGLMERFAGVFADLGGRDDLGDLSGRTEFAAQWNAVTGSDPVPSRVLYGSGWFLVGRELPDRCSLRDLAAVFADGGLRHLDRSRFFGGNAVAFLGLGKAALTRDRLQRFYARHGIPGDVVRWFRKIRTMEGETIPR